MAIAVLLSATNPTPVKSDPSPEPEPPSTPLGFSIELALAQTPAPTPEVIVGKSRATELAEKEAERIAELAKIEKKAAQEKAERIKHTAAQKKLATSHSEQKQAESVVVIGKSREQCVVYAKRVTGNSKIRGYAGDLKPEGTVPRVGAGALEKNYGHVSVVVAIEGEWLVLHDANYVKGSVTERRVHVSSQRGYIY